MPPKLRSLGGRDVLRALGACGFVVVSTRGSHAKLRRILADGTRQTLTIPLQILRENGSTGVINVTASDGGSPVLSSLTVDESPAGAPADPRRSQPCLSGRTSCPA